MNLDALNLIDLGAICLLVASVVGGLRSGAFPQVGGLLGAASGAGTALWLSDLLRDQVTSIENPTRAFVLVGGLIVLAGIGEVLGSMLGRAVSRSLGGGIAGTVDRLVGGAVGVGQAVLIVWLVGGLLALGPSSDLARQAQRSIAVRVISERLPPVTEVASDIGGLIDASGFPQVFTGLEPLPAPPVATPAEAAARKIAAAAIASTVAVESAACAYTLSGTGFAIAPGRIVTNAHVIAGAGETSVVSGGKRYPATVVLYDPALDIALLFVPRLEIPPLAFAPAEPLRGAVGAVLGHPGGGPLAVIPAAITGSYPAEGRDLYGKRSVTRQILELRAEIEHGDSGGPLILADGKVGGVVFAEAKSDPAVGYALSPSAVAARIGSSLGLTEPVKTGACIR